LLCATLAAVLATVATGCDARSGQVRLVFHIAPADLAGFRALSLASEWGGVNRGPERDADWSRVPAHSVRLAADPAGAPLGAATSAAGDGLRAEAAAGPVPAGDYLRAYVHTPRVEGVDAAGHAVEIEAHIEPTVLALPIPADGETTVVIDLIVLPLPHWQGPGHAIFVKGAHVAEGTEGSAR
jgi:hypothetical protein